MTVSKQPRRTTRRNVQMCAYAWCVCLHCAHQPLVCTCSIPVMCSVCGVGVGARVRMHACACIIILFVCELESARKSVQCVAAF